MAISIPNKIQPVIDRAEALDIPLLDFIDSIIKTYVHGGVTGIKFRPKNYSGLQLSVAKAIRKMVLFDDDYSDSVGTIMGSDARKHGYSVSAREMNLTNSLHVELNKLKCDVHLDSRSIVTGHTGFPYYGGHYDPTRLIPHGINDLAPSMLADSRLSFLSPVVSPILSRLNLEVSLRDRAPDTGARESAMLTGGKLPGARENYRVGFTLTFPF